MNSIIGAKTIAIIVSLIISIGAATLVILMIPKEAFEVMTKNREKKFKDILLGIIFIVVCLTVAWAVLSIAAYLFPT